MTAAPQPITIVARDARMRRRLIDELDDHERWQLQPLMSLSELTSQADATGCGVAIVEAGAAESTHAESANEFQAVVAALRVIVVAESPSVAETVRWMRRGVWSVASLAESRPSLVEVVSEACAADEEISAEVEAMSRTRNRLMRLTPRERQLLDEVIVGRSNKQIAAEWSVSERTVANHRANLLEKMRAVNTADLVRMAVEVRHSPLSQYLSARGKE